MHSYVSIDFFILVYLDKILFTTIYFINLDKILFLTIHFIYLDKKLNTI